VKWFCQVLSLSLTACWISIDPSALAAESLRPSAPKASPKPSKASSKPRNSAAQPKPAIDGIERLSELLQPSILTVASAGRNGSGGGEGTAFAIDASGLVVTCLHVIGEGRPITLTTADGQRIEVTEVHAWDRKLDLAILKVNNSHLKPLSLGDSEAATQGTAVITVGNPLGLRHSVVQGVISAKRDFNGVSMLQLAIPVEPGNSGGPVVDREGRVLGVVSMKSAMTPNLGFAIPVSLIKSLLDTPNPVPMARWRQLNQVDPKQWATLAGGTWSQRPGRIEVSGLGAGFGGRTLCLHSTPQTTPLSEMSVEVKLGSEEGAAGLVFGSDGADRHYGFYPSAGQLRLTRFDGPTVFTWSILSQHKSTAYKPGSWNELKVRHELGSITCWLNGELIIESKDDGLPPGQTGLVAFRETPASFRNFRSASTLPATPSPKPPDLSGLLQNPTAQKVADLVHVPLASESLRQRASVLEKEASVLRALASQVHYQGVQSELVSLLQGPPEATIDLAHAALLVAKLDNAELEIETYRSELLRMAQEILSRLPTASSSKPISDTARLAALNHYLFQENGYHGSRFDYYDRSNSYLSSVIEDHEGIPITLSILYLELARGIGLTNLVGIPLPGHFLVKQVTQDPSAKGTLIDVFDGGRPISFAEADELGSSSAGIPIRSEFLPPASKRDIIVRMLQNLHASVPASEIGPDSLRYLDTIVAIKPDSHEDRLARAQLRLQKGLFTPAREDLKWILDKAPEQLNLDRVAELYRSIPTQ